MGGSEMTNTAGCIPFGDHKGGVDTNPFKSIAGRLPKSSPCQSAGKNQRNPTILCVDDEPANCELLENILVASGYGVISAANGKDALLKIKTREIDLVLLDVIMPGMNGFEVCREIKESKKFTNIPVIMITALNAKEDRIKGIEAGAEEFLSKPFDKTEVLARIKMLLKVKKLEAALAQSEKHYRVTQSVITMILSESLEDISLELILQKALNMILSIPGLSFEPIGSIYLVEDGPGILVMKAQSNLSGPVKKLCRRIPFGLCLCGLAAQTRQIQSADHIDERHETCYEGMAPHGHYAVPILFGGRTLGVINIYLKEGLGRNQKEEDFLHSIANTLAGIIVRRHVEDERERLLTQLLQAQKMEAVGQLAGGISHDFNNILTAMIGYGHLLKMKMKEDDPLRTYADNILSLSDKAANLTQSLLAFSRKRIMNPCPANLNEIIKRIDYLLSRIIGEDIKLQTMLSEDDLIVMADSGQIEQVLMNLATNARDAMPEGGLLTIGTETLDIDHEFIKEHGYGNEGQYALISLTDTGAGMDRETREKIFEPFFTTKEVGKGTGLGLSMVYGIIKQHEGYINVYSEPGRGTTFRIYLPLIEAKAEEIKPEAIQPIETGTETVLLAEDEDAIREFIKKLLEEYGYKVITAGSGQEAIDEFKAHKDKIQLALLDVIMPNRNGKEAYEEIKKIRPDIKVLFMSGYPADIIHKHDIIEKGFAYIEKPASPTKLLRKIREVLGK
jgi:signal transduction histidine kinase/DNA-binding response OmpR family regulator